MEWRFIESDPDGRDLKDTTKSSVDSSKLTAVQVFVREVLQNSLDNNSSDDPVRIAFEIKDLTGKKKKDFLKEIGGDQFLTHLEASRNRMIKTRGGSYLSSQQELKDPDTPLRLLYIHDYGTRGLIGAELPSEAEKTKGPHCFVGLCRNTGDNQKSQPGEVAGGTNGFGKTVLWSASSVGTVLFYSRMESPHGGVDRRFFGQARLESYSLDSSSFKGVGYFGKPGQEPGSGRPMTLSEQNEAADQKAEKFSVKCRGDGESGTTALIVDFGALDMDRGQRDCGEISKEIIAAAEDYFWPAIDDGRLQVSCISHVGRKSFKIDASPHNRIDLSGFIDGYRALKGEKKEGATIEIEQVDVNVPAGPSASESKARGKIHVVVNKVSDATSDDISFPYNNRTALIRGAGMVVGYVKTSYTVGGFDFFGVVVAGRACANAGKADQRIEKLLAYSEPVTHDDWKKDSNNIKASNWEGAYTAVDKIVKGYKDVIARHTGRNMKPEGTAAPMLAKMFALTQGDDADVERDIGICNMMGPVQVGGAGEFSFELKIPPQNQFKAKVKPTRWQVSCTYGFIGEGGRDGSKVGGLSVPILAEKVQLDGQDLKLEESLQSRIIFEADITDSPQHFFLKGKTGPLSDFLSAFTRHELVIQVNKGSEDGNGLG